MVEAFSQRFFFVSGETIEINPINFYTIYTKHRSEQTMPKPSLSHRISSQLIFNGQESASVTTPRRLQ